MKKTIRLGTRKSPLAIYQAEKVKSLLVASGVRYVEIIPVLSDGDKNLKQPIYSMGISGVFTKSLDIALINNEIDIAVHSLKDVPTLLADGLELQSVLERDFNQDVLVLLDKNKTDLSVANTSVATGSLRRRAFILNKYPNVSFQEIRGNIQTRLKKMESIGCIGTVLSLAGIKRMKMQLNYKSLDFMMPSVGQGAIAIVSKIDIDKDLKRHLKNINHNDTFNVTALERSFLSTLEGGCTAPIGVLTSIENENILFKGSLLSLDGQKRIDTSTKVLLKGCSHEEDGMKLAKEILQNGGTALMKEIKKKIDKLV